MFSNRPKVVFVSAAILCVVAAPIKMPVCHPVPVSRRAHDVAMKTMANSEAIAVRLQKTCMAQKQCRQKSSIRVMTIAALPTIV